MSDQALKRLDDVRGVSVDPDTQRVQVRFDEQRLAAAEIVEQLDRLGFPADPESDEA